MKQIERLIKRLLPSAVYNPTFSRFLTLLEQAGGGQPNLLRILTYHRVDAPENFDQQMRYLKANYQVISMAELLHAWESGHSLPPHSIMITFDDAYCDFAEHAWPILKRYQLPVAVFVPTAFPDDPERVFWWDWLSYAIDNTARRDDLTTPCGQLSLATATERQQTYYRLSAYIKTIPHSQAMAQVAQICSQLDVSRPESGVLGWNALRQLAREGVTLGPHTQTHPLMNRISLAEVQAEAVGSLRDLEREIGSVLPIFAYPDGAFNDEVVRALASAGFRWAFTRIRGANRLHNSDRLRLRRNNVGRRSTLTDLRARLVQSSIYLNGWRPLSGVT